MDLVKDLQNRVKQYSPVWQQWTVGEQIGKGYHSAIFLLSSGDGEKEVMKAVTIEAASKDQLDEIEAKFCQLIQLKHCRNTIMHEAYMTKILRDSKSKEVLGYDVLIRMKSFYSLEKLMKEGTVLTEQEVIALALDIAQGLANAGELGISHGNVKPSNIFIIKGKEKRPIFCLADFEICQMRGSISKDASSVSYMAPEVYKGEDNPDRISSDVYSFGIVLFELLNQNRLPFFNEERNNWKQAVSQRIQGAPFPEIENLHSDIDEVIIKSCSYNPQLRYQDFREIISDLQECQRQIEHWKNAHRTRKDSSPQQTRVSKKGKNKKPFWIAGLIGMAVLVGIGVWAISVNRQAAPAGGFAQETTVNFSSSLTATIDLPAGNSENTDSITPSETNVTTQAAEETSVEEETTEETSTEIETTPSETESVEILPVSIVEGQIQALLDQEEQWRQNGAVDENGVPVTGNGVGFVDLDQDGTLEFIYGCAGGVLTGVDTDYYMNYSIYSIKDQQLQLLGTCKSLDLKYNTQSGHTVLFGNIYTVGQEDANGFSGCIETEEISMINGSFINKRLFSLWRNRPAGSEAEKRTFFAYDESGQEREISYPEYEAELNEYMSSLQSSTAKLSYVDWDTDWATEKKREVLQQAYNSAK